MRTVGMGGGGAGRRRGGGWWGSGKSLKRAKKNQSDPEANAKFKEAIGKSMLRAKPGSSMKTKVTGRKGWDLLDSKPGSTMSTKVAGRGAGSKEPWRNKVSKLLKKTGEKAHKSRRLGKKAKAAAGLGLAASIWAAMQGKKKKDKKSKK